MNASTEAAFDGAYHRAREHRHFAEAQAHYINRLLATDRAAKDLLVALLALHARERARCTALGVSLGTLDETLLRYDVVDAATLALNMEASN